IGLCSLTTCAVGASSPEPVVRAAIHAQAPHSANADIPSWIAQRASRLGAAGRSIRKGQLMHTTRGKGKVWHGEHCPYIAIVATNRTHEDYDCNRTVHLGARLGITRTSGTTGK